MRLTGCATAITATLVLWPPPAEAQSHRAAGRVSVFAHTAVTSTADGARRTFSEIVTSLRLRPPADDTTTATFGLDLRSAVYPGAEERTPRLSVYEAFVGRRLANPRLYQAAEIDLAGPAGQGSGGVTYFFTNVRASPSSRVELQG